MAPVLASAAQVVSMNALNRVDRGEEETRVRTAGIASFRDGKMLSWHDYGDEASARAKAAEN